MNTSRKLAGSAALTLGLLISASVFAQETTGALDGSAPMGYSVSVRNVATELRLDAVVEKTGRFHFGFLPTGIYEVVIHHPDGSAEPPILARARLGETVQVN